MSLSPQELSCHREQEAGPRSLRHYYPAVCQELADLTGRVNRDGTAAIWAITSTVSGSGQGADPNKMVMITDNLAATSLPAGETFTTLRTARLPRYSVVFLLHRSPACRQTTMMKVTATVEPRKKSILVTTIVKASADADCVSRPEMLGSHSPRLFFVVGETRNQTPLQVPESPFLAGSVP
jgi:hypothetical protein